MDFGDSQELKSWLFNFLLCLWSWQWSTGATSYWLMITDYVHLFPTSYSLTSHWQFEISQVEMSYILQKLANRENQGFPPQCAGLAHPWTLGNSLIFLSFSFFIWEEKINMASPHNILQIFPWVIYFTWCLVTSININNGSTLIIWFSLLHKTLSHFAFLTH